MLRSPIFLGALGLVLLFSTPAFTFPTALTTLDPPSEQTVAISTIPGLSVDGPFAMRGTVDAELEISATPLDETTVRMRIETPKGC